LRRESIDWSSSNPSVASVGSMGNVAGVSAGEADIVATYQGVTGRSHVTITRAAVSTYTISGTVTDGTSGGILPNINISATDAGGNSRSTLTGSSGTYTLTGLIAGQVTITASAISYQTTVLTVTLTGDAHVDIVLPRVVCTFTLSPTSLSFPSSGGTGTVTVTSHAVGCARTAKANDAFLAIVSGGAGNDNGTVMFSVASNAGTARTGTLTVAGLTVTATQEGAFVRASYDPTFQTPVCHDIGSGCDSGTMLQGAGVSEVNQPNTILSSCPDGAGLTHFAVITAIQVVTLDGTAMAPGKTVKINVTLAGSSSSDHATVYITADALHPVWTHIADAFMAFGTFSVQTSLPVGTMAAVRVTFAFGGGGPGPHQLR
jgi:hypothetical protein